MDFIMGCPVKGCSKNKELITWRCECGETETIDSDGIVKCKKGHNNGEFFRIRYDCKDGHGHQYGGFSSFLAAISICSNFGAEFAFKITKKIFEAYKEGTIPNN